MENVKSTTKAKRDLKIAEIVYYSIGGVALVLGVVFSIFGLILLNPIFLLLLAFGNAEYNK